jgi:type III secretion protein U
MAEKTEKATPKKLRDARKKGQVAKSQDFPSAFTFIVSIAATIATTGFLFEQLAGFFVSTFRHIGRNIDLQDRAGSFITQSLMVILNASLPIVIITALVGVLINFIIVGPLFAPEAFKLDLKKLNPVTNIKNMFKFKTIFELLKSIFKITGALILIMWVVWGSLPEIVATAALPVFASAQVFNSFLFKVIVRVGIFFLAVAVADLVFQKRNFAKEMMMEKFEVKQEFKDTEGDPQIKSRRKQVAQEIAYQEGPSAVKRAKAVITNPIHIADAEKEPAPKIVTMGKGITADLIIKAALEYHIPIMRNVVLAQILYEKGKISDYIPEETYQAVAEILKWLTSIEAAEYNVELFK